MHSQSNPRSTKARPGLLIPKNSQDQLKLKINCKAKNTSGIFLFCSEEDKINANEIAINVYKIVQTIGKTKLGGVPGGWIR